MVRSGSLPLIPLSIPGVIGEFGCRGEGGIASEWRTISGIQRKLRTGRPGNPRARGLNDDDDDDDNHEDEDDSPRFSRARDRSTTDTRFSVTPAVSGHRKLLNCGSRTVARSCRFSTDRKIGRAHV